jgi:hypothetical protein
MNLLYLILSVLSTWRLTHLLAKEDGPWYMIYTIRKAAGAGFFGNLLDCFYCLSIWIALPFGIWLGSNWWEKILSWLALSGAACLLEQATTSTNKQQDNKPDYRED